MHGPPSRDWKAGFSGLPSLPNRMAACVPNTAILKKETDINGSGMAIINPPWQLDTELLDYLPWLWKTLSIQKQGGYSVKLL